MVIRRTQRSPNGVNQAINPGSYRTRRGLRACCCRLQQQLRQHTEFVADASTNFGFRIANIEPDVGVTQAHVRLEQVHRQVRQLRADRRTGRR